MAIFGQMDDPRRTSKGNLKHPLVDILFLVVSAVVSGCNDWEAIETFGEGQIGWLRKYYPYKQGIPSHDTINRVFSALEPNIFREKFIAWTQEISTLSQGEVVAIDGKTIRRSYDKKGHQSAFHVVSAYAEKNRVCLGQVLTEEKSNEITAIPALLDLLFLENTTVTIDAIGCQKAIVKKIITKKADYLIAVKNNQKALYQELENLFTITAPASQDTQQNVDHARVETRTCTVITDLTFLGEKENWPKIASVVKVDSERYIKSSAQTTTQTRFYISSLTQDAKTINSKVRKHWAIENRLHWMLDVVFQEDASRRRRGNSAANFNIIAKVALALIEQTPHKKSKRQRRFKAGFDPKFREKVLKI